MSKRARNRRAGRLAAALLVAGFGLAACEEEVQSPPLTGISTEVASLRVTLGTGQTLTLFKDGKITLSPLTFTRPTTTISVVSAGRMGAISCWGERCEGALGVAFAFAVDELWLCRSRAGNAWMVAPLGGSK